MKTFIKKALLTWLVYWICLVLITVGGLNWGLVGLFNFDLVAAIFGSMTIMSRLIYILVGLAAVTMIIIQFKKDKIE